MATSARVIVVTGAGSGIGRASALAFAARGALVVAADKNLETARETAALAEASGHVVVAHETDVVSRRAVDQLVARACDLGPLVALVANAGVAIDRPFLDVAEDELDVTLAVNVKGVFFCGQAAAKAMVHAGRAGAIINVASTYGEVACPECAAYCASKGAVKMLTKVMALELGGFGIRVNAVAPGFVRTGMNPLDDPERNRCLEQAIPLGRLGAPADIADVICWLASDGARYVNGETIIVDGGWIVQ
jgi:NAD(P)-dependent dehydrogenase (short-subunit alcohol dehydrogenase family)